MNVTGIIAEYNPFHNGHAYHLREAKKQTDADYLIVAMSGDFLQRGVPAIVDKHTRARMALLSGADLVLELSAPWATGSAEFFASGAVRLLAATGVVQSICYGMEAPAALLCSAASFLACPPPAFERTVSSLARQGMSYPRARQEALVLSLPQYPPKEVRAFLSCPNNILAIEYEKAILRQNAGGSDRLHGLGIRRVGDGYHETDIRTCYASATAIRRLLLPPKDPRACPAKACDPTQREALSPVLPPHCLTLLEQAAAQGLLMDADDFSGTLFSRLLLLQSPGYSGFMDCTDSISRRIAGHLNRFISFSQFADLIKTKDVTRTRVNRVLTHILLNLYREDYAQTTVPYLRVLGFSRRALPLLSEIDKKASAPLLTKVADASHRLSAPAMRALHTDLSAADLYCGIRRIKSGLFLPDEYRTGIIIP